MKIDQKRKDRQLQAVHKWRDSNYKGTFEWATGTGKTYTAMLAIQTIREHKGNISVMIVVPTDYLRNQWREELKRHNIHNAYVNTVHSWIRQESLSFDLMILDEIHAYTGGEVFSTIFNKPNYQYILGLTAQQREEPDEQALLNRKAPIIDRMNLTEAVKSGYVNQFTVYNVGLELDHKSREEYDLIHTQFMKFFSTFFFDLKTMIRSLNNLKQREDIARVYKITEKDVFIRAINANRLLTKRKSFLYNAPTIFETTLELIRRYPNKRILTFSEVTKFADLLYDKMPQTTGVYHSNIPSGVTADGKLVATSFSKGIYLNIENRELMSLDELKSRYSNVKRIGKEATRKYHLDRFLNGDVNTLHTAKALNVGVNIPNVDMSILCSYTSSTIESIQRTGRAIRKQEGKQAIEVNLYIRNSQSEKWLKKKQRQTPNVKWIDSIDQIAV